MLSSLSLCLVLVVLSDALAAPQTGGDSPGGLSMDLKRRTPKARTRDEWGDWARTQRDILHTKYGRSAPQKRSTGTNLLVNQGTDSSFYGSLAIGTPAVSYNVILDTGSADLWVADSNCVSGCANIPTFDVSSSSSYSNLSQSFSITYGQGAAAGVLAKDVIQMAGFSVSDQVFATCDRVSQGLLSDPVSGLLGLAWSSISSAGTTPFWQALASGGAWDDPLMAFQLTRYRGVANAGTLEPGGTFTMGALNSSLYSGDIEYHNLVDSSYWMLAISSLAVQGSAVTVGSGSNTYAAIDTGTTLVGGPAAQIAEVFSNVPDSVAGSGNYEGYYLYPCDTQVNVSVSFGGKDWTISGDDFQLSRVSEEQCLGAFFEFDSSNGGPAWIFGDTFLKNVYSVYRYDTPAVGFAQLSNSALSMNGDVNADIPSATIGSVAAQVSATGSTSRHSDGAASSGRASPLVYLGVIGLTAALTMFHP